MAKKNLTKPKISLHYTNFPKQGLQSSTIGNLWQNFTLNIDEKGTATSKGSSSDLDMIGKETDEEKKIKFFRYDKGGNHEFSEKTPEEIRLEQQRIQAAKNAAANARAKAARDKPEKIAYRNKIIKDAKGKDVELITRGKGKKKQYLWTFDGKEYPSGLSKKDLMGMSAKAKSMNKGKKAGQEGFVTDEHLYLEAKNKRIQEINKANGFESGEPPGTSTYVAGDNKGGSANDNANKRKKSNKKKRSRRKSNKPNTNTKSGGSPTSKSETPMGPPEPPARDVMAELKAAADKAAADKAAKEKAQREKEQKDKIWPTYGGTYKIPGTEGT